jgi:hypothetical protein
MEAKDRHGKTIREGMKVKVVGIPDFPDYMIEETQPVFQRALGRVFPVYAIDDHGQAWVEVEGEKFPNEHSIGLEPEYVEVVEI